jgi:rhamnosyl/mannosyltransferase
LQGYLKACDVFCIPSTVRAEAYGVAIVESMVMGKLIVAADIPGSGVPWVHVHRVTGLNVGARQPHQLGAALAQLLEDGALRARLGAVARRRYQQEFNAALMTRHMLDLHHGLRAAA